MRRTRKPEPAIMTARDPIWEIDALHMRGILGRYIDKPEKLRGLMEKAGYPYTDVVATLMRH